MNSASIPVDRNAHQFCCDCFEWDYDHRDINCRACGSPRIVDHPDLKTLAIAHIDCDAFYASVEKRDNPDLWDKPVIVGGGGRRGVVSAACYIARAYGVRSAMPMYKALKACPNAVVIKPNMAKYTDVGQQVRRLMLDTTPLVEPISIDEAFLDLTGTESLHRAPPSETLARLLNRIQSEVGITASCGLSYNKFLAKVASDLEKPRGFSVIGQAEASAFLAKQPVEIIWGVGKSLKGKLQSDELRLIGDLQAMEEPELIRRYGGIGSRLSRFSRGLDDRKVDPESKPKSVSNEITFNEDISDFTKLEPVLWRLSESVSQRLKRKNMSGRVVILKLKTADFRTLSRRTSLLAPTQLADMIFRTSKTLLAREVDGRHFRLLGVGVSELVDGSNADPIDLADPGAARRKRIERVIDDVREKMGTGAIGKGRGIRQLLRKKGQTKKSNLGEDL